MPVLTQVEYPQAVLIPSPNLWEGRQGYTGPMTLVIHATAGFASALDVARYFQTNGGGNPVSSHFVIARDGTVYQCLSIYDSCYGEGAMTSPSGYWPKYINGNFMTIAIECHKPSTDNSDTPTEAQYLSLATVSKWVCEQLNIPKVYINSNKGGICSHGFFDPDHRSNINGAGGDPGTFDWTHYFTLFNGGDVYMPDLQLAQVAQVYYLDGGKWHCKVPNHNYVISGAILDYYVGLVSRAAPLGGYTSLGLPLESETQVSPNFWTQPFERGLVWCEYPKNSKDSPPMNIGTYNAHLEPYYEAYEQSPRLQSTVAAQQRELLLVHTQLAQEQKDHQIALSELAQCQAAFKAAGDHVYAKAIATIRADLSSVPPAPPL